MSLVKVAVVLVVLASAYSIALALRQHASDMIDAACPACQVAGDSSPQYSEPPSADTEACPACESVASPGRDSPHASSDAESEADSASNKSDPPPIGRQSIVSASDKDFDRALRQAPGMVLVDFYADWCGPCRVQGQILEQLVQSREDMTIIKVNIDQSPVLARQFEISSIPTLLAFRDRQFLGAHVGVASEETIRKMFQEERPTVPSHEK